MSTCWFYEGVRSGPVRSGPAKVPGPVRSGRTGKCPVRSYTIACSIPKINLTIFRKSSRNLQEIFKKSSRNLQKIFKKSSRNLQEIFKKSSKNLQKIFKKSSKIRQKIGKKFGKIGKKSAKKIFINKKVAKSKKVIK